MALRAARCAGNPLITPAQVPPSRPDLKVVGVFNAAATLHDDEVVLMLRVAETPVVTDPARPAVVSGHSGVIRVEHLDRGALELAGWDFSDPRIVRGPSRRGGLTVRHLTSISHLRIARSHDGESFEVAAVPTLAPWDELESWGCEDPRLVRIAERYHLTYTAVSPLGIATRRATSDDLVHWKREGLLFPPENRNVALFPEPIGGMYYALHRPVPQMIGEPAIWLARSPDLSHWGDHQLITTTAATGWQSGRIGAAAPPLRTPAGWLVTYHAADQANRYCLGAMLFDLADPARCTHRLPMPILQPEEPYERDGFFSAVVFSCGAVIMGSQLWVYYGAADQTVAAARYDLPELLAALLDHPVNENQVS